MATTKHLLVALVEDKPGVLNRMASIFRRRGFNIESVNVIEMVEGGGDGSPHLTRVVIVVAGQADMLDLVRKQLEKIVDVVKVSDIVTRDTA